MRRRRDWTEEARADLVRRYAVAVPAADALEALALNSPHRVVEVEAGTDYRAYFLTQAGVDDEAFDNAPSPDARKWFGATAPWYPVQLGDQALLEHFARPTSILVGPTRNRSWPSDALAGKRHARGRQIVYVGEGPGGRTGDHVFHPVSAALQQSSARCTPVTRVSGINADGRRSGRVALPHWPVCHDDLHVYDATRPRSRPDRRRRWTIPWQ